MRIVLSLCLVCAGCAPPPDPGVPRPEQITDFTVLYRQNCAGCHGENGKNGAAISLANPVYLAFAGQAAVRQITANGIAGKRMPPFAQSAGGTLTDSQIDALVEGMFKTWGGSAFPTPPYSPGTKGDAAQGKQTYAQFCARCHPDGGSLADPAYLALVSDQSLRGTIVAGMPGMPDWRSAGPRAMTDQEITDVVAWLASKRVAP